MFRLHTLYPYSSRGPQPTATNRTARKSGAAAPSACPAGRIAADVATLYSRNTVVAHGFTKQENSQQRAWVSQTTRKGFCISRQSKHGAFTRTIVENAELCAEHTAKNAQEVDMNSAYLQ